MLITGLLPGSRSRISANVRLLDERVRSQRRSLKIGYARSPWSSTRGAGRGLACRVQPFQPPTGSSRSCCAMSFSEFRAVALVLDVPAREIRSRGVAAVFPMLHGLLVSVARLVVATAAS